MISAVNATHPRVGFVGLGKMGAPMSRRLVAAGYDVLGFDVAETARAEFSDAGGTAVSDVAALGSACDTVILMLPSSAVVAGVLEGAGGAGGLEAALPASSVLIDMGSSEPLRTRAIAERLAAKEITVVDAPVSGGVKGAENGTLTIMAGGPAAALDGVEPLLATLGSVVRTGPVGSGHALKALNNLLSATHLWITSEAITAGERFGLDPEVMLAAFNRSSGRSGSTENKWPNFILPGTYDSGFALSLMVKDMRIALGLAQAVGVDSALAEAAVAEWAAADNGLPGADHTEVAKWISAIGTDGSASPPPSGIVTA